MKGLEHKQIFGRALASVLPQSARVLTAALALNMVFAVNSASASDAEANSNAVVDSAAVDVIVSSAVESVAGSAATARTSGMSSSSLALEFTGLTTPKGYQPICRYGETCAVAKPTLVAFGSHGQFSYKLLRGAFECSERAFNRNPLNTDATSCSIAEQRTDNALKKVALTSAADLKPGKYALLSRHSSKALTLGDEGITQQAYKKAGNQHFDLSLNADGYLQVAAGEEVLSVEGWEINDGASVTMGAADDSWNQHWAIEDARDKGYFVIKSRFNGKSLDVVGLNTHSSAQVRLWTYWGGKNQQWKLIPVKTATGKTTPVN